jgi:hypothetical protein
MFCRCIFFSNATYAKSTIISILLRIEFIQFDFVELYLTSFCHEFTSGEIKDFMMGLNYTL